MNYSPSLNARGLATSQTFSLGFFVREKPGLSAQTDPFYGEILQGAEQSCARTDYHITIATLTSDILEKPDRFRFVRGRRIDGMILAGPDIPSDFIMAMLHTGLPVVLVDNRLAHSSVNCVNSDDENGAYAAAAHLLELGHRRIGIISGPEAWASNTRRIRGYMRALRDADVPVRVVHVDRTTIESGQKAYQQIIAEHSDLTALCAVNDSMAIGAIRAARAHGRIVPDDLSIVGFDDIAWAQLNDPPLTTVSIPKGQMGKEAVTRLINILDDPDLHPTEITLSVKLVSRETCRKM